MKLEHKVALITGAAGGIGREASLLFSREGATVVAVDLNETGGEETVALIQKQGGRGHFVPADVSKSTTAKG